MKKNIILIGFMGCGKSTISKALAKSLNAQILDTDKLIEEKFKLETSEIFKQFGEQMFRDAETNIAMILDALNNAVVATGGGFYKALLTYKNCVVIYLRADFETILERMNEQEIAKRPLFANLEKAKKLFDERKFEYEKKADFIIDIKNKSVEEITNEIIEKFKS